MPPNNILTVDLREEEVAARAVFELDMGLVGAALRGKDCWRCCCVAEFAASTIVSSIGSSDKATSAEAKGGLSLAAAAAAASLEAK